MSETIEQGIIVAESSRARRELPAVQPPAQATPMTMLAMAVQQGADLAKLEKLMELQRQWEANEARKAFTDAMAAFKADPPAVYKDKQNKQYDNAGYTSIGQWMNTVNPHLSKHGLSASWDLDQSAGIRVTCKLTHKLGHSESVSMAGPADASGQKNPLQQIKSTVTYLKISTFELITGLASLNANQDDDGNGAGKETGLPKNQYAEFVKNIEAATTKAAAKLVFQGALKVCASAKDKASAESLKAVLLKHGEFLDGVEKAEKK